MDDLTNIRSEIDLIDKDLVELLEKRLDLVKSVIEYKINNNIDILDTSREDYILEKNRSLLQNTDYSNYIDDLFISIMKTSREMQNKILKESSND